MKVESKQEFYKTSMRKSTIFLFGQKGGEEKLRPAASLFEFDQIIHYLIDNKGRFRCRNPENFRLRRADLAE